MLALEYALAQPELFAVSSQLDIASADGSGVAEGETAA